MKSGYERPEVLTVIGMNAMGASFLGGGVECTVKR
jgi:hypothetical protein